MSDNDDFSDIGSDGMNSDFEGDEETLFESETHDSYNMETQDTILSVESIYDKYHNQVKKTKPLLDKFEYTKLLGIRAQMIANGSPALVDTTNLTDIIDIVKKEYIECKIPLFVKRTISNGESEYWRIEDFSNYRTFI